MASAAPDVAEDQDIIGDQRNNSSESTIEMEACDDNGLSRLLERMKLDTMYELRNIEHSHRPVTGQEHRQALHQFMKKHITDPNQSKGNVPSNTDDVAEHRPESVIVEVQGIVEQRPVSSVLQSAAFRHRLENIIRGSLESTRRQSPLISRRSSPLNSASQRQSRERTPASTSQRLERSQASERPHLERHDSTTSISSVESFSSALSSADQDNERLEDFVMVPQPVPRTNTTHRPTPPPRTHPSESTRQSPALSEPSSTGRQEADDEDTGLSWNDISRVHREELIQEISELLHNRLVSSTLDGEFRATLEVLVENRVDSNGPAVQDFVQSLPGRGIPRNDFSHLGIGPLNDLDNSDNISIASVSAHSVPYTQTNTYLGREIQSLRSQMKDMMNMIKLTHELQMDIQRSIRQEVSAALSQISAGEGASASSCSGLPSSRPVKDTHCLICLERHTDSVLYQCGHMCVCYLCGKDLIARKHCCPVCRAPIKDVIRAYKTNAE